MLSFFKFQFFLIDTCSFIFTIESYIQTSTLFDTINTLPYLKLNLFHVFIIHYLRLFCGGGPENLTNPYLGGKGYGITMHFSRNFPISKLLF